MQADRELLTALATVAIVLLMALAMHALGPFLHDMPTVAQLVGL